MGHTAQIIKVALVSAVLGWLLASLLLMGLFAFVGRQDHDGGGMALGLGVVIVLGALPTVLISTATLGVLWHQHASRRHLTKNSHYWLPGIIFGGLVAAVVPLITLPGINLSWLPLIAIGTLYGAVCGGLVGLFAWQMLRNRETLMRSIASEQPVVPENTARAEAHHHSELNLGFIRNPVRLWTQVVAIGFAILTVALVLWAVVVSPH